MASPSAPVSPAVRSISIPRNANQRITTDSALQPIVTFFVARSTWGRHGCTLVPAKHLQ